MELGNRKIHIVRNRGAFVTTDSPDKNGEGFAIRGAATAMVGFQRNNHVHGRSSNRITCKGRSIRVNSAGAGKSSITCGQRVCVCAAAHEQPTNNWQSIKQRVGFTTLVVPRVSTGSMRSGLGGEPLIVLVGSGGKWSMSCERYEKLHG